MVKEHGDWKPLAEFLRAACLVPGSSKDHNSLLEKAGIVTPGGTTPIPRSQEVRGAIKYIVDQVREANV